MFNANIKTNLTALASVTGGSVEKLMLASNKCAHERAYLHNVMIIDQHQPVRIGIHIEGVHVKVSSI